MNTRRGCSKTSIAAANKRGLIVRAVFILALVLAAKAAHARGREDTCSSYTSITGTTRTECR